MYSRNIANKIIYVCVFLLAIVAICYIYVEVKPEDKLSFIVAVSSATIALFALIISIKTYISIDSVNAMSKMDGNVMENENYRTSIFAIIRTFSTSEKKSKKEESDVILDYIESLFTRKKIKSGATLADAIQNFVDVVVLIAFVIHKKEEKKKNEKIFKRLRKIIRKMDYYVKRYEQMSIGSCTLINESAKLIKSIINYQGHQVNCQVLGGDDEELELIDVRGSMLKNSISRALYYDYLGLMCMRKADSAIIKVLDNGNKDILSIDMAKKLSKYKDPSASIFLRQANINFDKATEMIEGDLMWNAFLLYNKARVQYLQSMINNDGNTEWIETMRQAIDYRLQFHITLDDMIKSTSDSFFQRAFKDEYYLAEFMNVRLLYATGHKDLINIQILESIKAIIGTDEFQHFERFRKDIDVIFKEFGVS